MRNIICIGIIYILNYSIISQNIIFSIVVGVDYMHADLMYNYVSIMLIHKNIYTHVVFI
jgi:hypothetical protein